MAKNNKRCWPAFVRYLQKKEYTEQQIEAVVKWQPKNRD